MNPEDNIEQSAPPVAEAVVDDALPESIEPESSTIELDPDRHGFLACIVEAALLAAGDTLSLERMGQLFEDNERPPKQDLLAALALLQSNSLARGFELVEVASGWRLQVREEFAPWVNRLWEEKPQRYSRALLETLALIAYRQPITRGDIEEVRGVAVSSHIIKTLAEREWIKVVGQRDVPGRPSLYATTRQFLDYFNLKNLQDLPSLSELKDIDNLNQSLGLEELAATEFEQIAEAKEEGSNVDVAFVQEPELSLSQDTLTLHLFDPDNAIQDLSVQVDEALSTHKED